MNYPASESQRRALLTTRLRACVAAFLTLFVLVQAIRGLLHPPNIETDWASLLFWYLHGWFGTIAKVGWYLFFCWIAFALIRTTKQWERLFFVGWFIDLLLSPLRVIGPEWALPTRLLGLVGLLTALLAALSLVLSVPNPQEPG